MLVVLHLSEYDKVPHSGPVCWDSHVVMLGRFNFYLKALYYGKRNPTQRRQRPSVAYQTIKWFCWLLQEDWTGAGQTHHIFKLFDNYGCMVVLGKLGTEPPPQTNVPVPGIF